MLYIRFQSQKDLLDVKLPQYSFFLAFTGCNRRKRLDLQDLQQDNRFNSSKKLKNIVPTEHFYSQDIIRVM